MRLRKTDASFRQHQHAGDQFFNAHGGFRDILRQHIRRRGDNLVIFINHNVIHRARNVFAPISSTISAVSISVPIVRRSGKSKILGNIAGAIQIKPSGFPAACMACDSALR